MNRTAAVLCVGLTKAASLAAELEDDELVGRYLRSR
jgi:hypothetical protein